MGVLCVILIFACLYDYRQGRIPNVLFLPALAAGCIWGGMSGRGAAGYLLPGAVVLAALYPLFRIGVIGAGDVKLLSVCVGYFPHQKILYFLFFSLLISAIISVFKICKQKNLKERIAYLWEYAAAVAVSGHWRLYFCKDTDRRSAGICLSGPILCSMLLYWGGVY